MNIFIDHIRIHKIDTLKKGVLVSDAELIFAYPTDMNPHFYKKDDHIIRNFYELDSHFQDTTNSYKIGEPKPRVKWMEEDGYVGYIPILIYPIGVNKLRKGEWLYSKIHNRIFKCIHENQFLDENIDFKVLALPEHFSFDHLQSIVNGKLKQGKILVKCEYDYEDQLEGDQFVLRPSGLKCVSLDYRNHITLYEFTDDITPVSLLKKAFDAGQLCYQCDGNEGTDWNTWLKNNVK